MIIANKLIEEKHNVFGSFFSLFNNSSQVKVRNFFKMLSRDYGIEIEGTPGIKSIPFPLSFTEIATLTSTSPQILEMILNDFEEEGLIRFDQDRIQIKNL